MKRTREEENLKMLIENIPYKKYAPLGHQLEALDHLNQWFDRGYNYGALYLDMGLGKSYCTIMLAAKLFLEAKIDRVLVVAPNGIHDQWRNEQFPEHCPVEYEGYIWDNSKTRRSKYVREAFFKYSGPKLKVLYVNVDRFSYGDIKKLPEILEYVRDGKTLMVIDEATDIKNHKANRSENLTNLGRSADYKVILTGTPITNSPFDLYSMVDFLRPGFWRVPFHAFQKKYGLLVRDPRKHFLKPLSRREFDQIQTLGRSNKWTAEEIAHMINMDESSVRFILENPNHKSSYKNLDELKQMIAPFSFFKKKEECVDLPPKMFQTLYVEMSTQQKKVYSDLVKHGMSEFSGDEISVQNKLTLALRLQQVTSGFFPYQDEDRKAKYKPIDDKNPKIELLKHEIGEAGDQKIIVWARFRSDIEQIEKEIGKEFPDKIVATYYGSVSKEEREKRKQAFQNGQIDIMIMNQSTGSMGLNFQIATLQYFYSNSYSIKDRMQCEDRSHRMGQDKPVMYKEIACKDSVDVRIISALKEKKNLADTFRAGEKIDELFF